VREKKESHENKQDIHRDRQADRNINRCTDTQTDTHIDRQTGHPRKQTYRKTRDKENI
jgi:hypothetical protein